MLEPWRWQSFPELKGKGLRCLVEAVDGSIWFGTNKGVKRYDGLRWQTFTESDGVLGSPVNALVAAPDGTVYAGSDKGISQYIDGSWRRVFPPDDGLPWPVDDLMVASDGALWAATAWGGLRLQEGSAELFTTDQMAVTIGSKAPDIRIRTLPNDIAPGQAWGKGTGIKVIRGGYLGIPRGNAPMPIWALARDGPGEAAGLHVGDVVHKIGSTLPELPHLALEGEGNLVRLQVTRVGGTDTVEVQVERADVPGVVQGFSVTDVHEDREGRIWFGVSWGGQIVRYDPRETTPWRVFDERDGLSPGDRPKIAEAPDGSIWTVSNHDRAINRFDGRKWDTFSTAGLPAGNDIHAAVLATRDGSVLVGGHGGKIYVYRDGEWNIIGPDHTPVSKTRITGLIQTTDGTIWIAMLGQEAARLDYGTQRWKTLEELSFQVDAGDGALWFITEDSRIVHFDGRDWWAHGVADGLMDSPRAILKTRAGQIWAAGRHQNTAATATLVDGKWRMTIHGRLSSGIDKRVVFEAMDGSVWFGASVDYDINRGQLGRILQYVDGTWVHHKPPEAPSFSYGIGQTTDGILWFGGGHLTRYDGTTWSDTSEPEEMMSWIHGIQGLEDGSLWVSTRAYGLFNLNSTLIRRFR